MRFRKKRARNRRKKESSARKVRRALARSFKVIAAAGVLALVVFSGWKLYGWVLTTEHLHVKKIEVTGTQMASIEEVAALSGIKEGENIFAFTSDEARQNIEKNPWVVSAKITRALPETVFIDVTERRPVALVKMDDLYIMDGGGVIFKRHTRGDALDLPIITGLTDEVLKGDDGSLQAGLLELLALLDGREGLGAGDVSEINIDQEYGISIYTVKSGTRLEVGRGGFAAKLDAFDRIVASRGGTLKGIDTMDLSKTDEVIVRFSTKVVKEGGAA